MIEIIGDPIAHMSCTSVGNGVGSRTAAWCVSPAGGDVSCAMVKGGWALRWCGTIRVRCISPSLRRR
jgi:hypothetical protein